jgi:hypothetical protein
VQLVIMQKLSEPVPSIARAGNWARWQTLTLFGLLSLYVALATYKIHLPGIYYDEILSLAPAPGKTTKPVSDVSPALAETYQMIRETGSRRSIDNDTHEY